MFAAILRFVWTLNVWQQKNAERPVLEITDCEYDFSKFIILQNIHQDKRLKQEIVSGVYA